LLGSIRLPLASPLQEAGLKNRVPGKSAANTHSSAVLATLAFPAVLGSLVETSEPATALRREDGGPGEAKPTTARRSPLGTAARGRVPNSQLCQEEPLAAALPASLAVSTATVPPPVAATSTAPGTTAEDLACVAQAAAPEGYPATWSKVTAREAQHRDAADPAPGEEDTPSLLDPSAARSPHSTAPLPDSSQPATVAAPQPQELSAGLSAPPRPPSKRPVDQVSPAPAAARPDGTPAAVQAAVRNGPVDSTAATAHRALFQAATAESTRHSAATAIQSPLPTGALDPARYGARELGESAQSGGGKAVQLAFGARLVPTAGPLEAPAGDPPDPVPVPSSTPARPSAAAPLDGAVAEPASEAAVTPVDRATGQTGDAAEDNSSLPASIEKGEADAPARFRKSETPTASSWEASSASAARLSPDAVYAPAEGLAKASHQPERAAAAAPQTAAPPEPGAGAEASKPPAAARNIQFDVNGGDRRVEVRLTERGGEVQVAVRTPDANLASALREDLPALSSRLAESGFRAETWHPASPGTSSGAPSGQGDWHKLTEPSAGGPPQDPNGRPRQNGGQPNSDSQPRQPQTREQQPNRKDQGKDFTWLMSSLR
jgi:hypothetical protein